MLVLRLALTIPNDLGPIQSTRPFSSWERNCTTRWLARCPPQVIELEDAVPPSELHLDQALEEQERLDRWVLNTNTNAQIYPFKSRSLPTFSERWQKRWRTRICSTRTCFLSSTCKSTSTQSKWWLKKIVYFSGRTPVEGLFAYSF